MKGNAVLGVLVIFLILCCINLGLRADFFQREVKRINKEYEKTLRLEMAQAEYYRLELEKIDKRK